MLIVVLLGAGLALLLIGGELLVRGASRLALQLGLTPLLVGLTVVAFATSAPELAVSVAAALRGQPDLALGNVVGSNIANILLVLGLAAAVRPLAVPRQLLRLDVPVMIGASAAVVLLGLDGRIGRFEGLLLLTCLAAYVAVLVRNARRAAIARPFAARPRDRVVVRVGQVVAGVSALVLGAHWMVRGAVSLARALGVGELVIGLTVVAVGTSLPEIVSSAVASARGEREIAAGNVIGSNTFNLLLVLGAAATLAPGGVAVAPGALRFDLPVMVGVAVLVVPVLFTRWTVSRLEGVGFLTLYAGYLGYIVLDAKQHALLPAYGAAMAGLVLPIVAIVLAVLSLRQWRRDHR